MKYWMKFTDNDNNLMISISDISFMGRKLSIPELKSRFNADFVKGTARTVEISFNGSGVNRSFIAGIRDKSVVICDMHTKQEYSPKQFSEELNILEGILELKIPELEYAQ